MRGDLPHIAQPGSDWSLTEAGGVSACRHITMAWDGVASRGGYLDVQLWPVEATSSRPSVLQQTLGDHIAVMCCPDVQTGKRARERRSQGEVYRTARQTELRALGRNVEWVVPEGDRANAGRGCATGEEKAKGDNTYIYTLAQTHAYYTDPAISFACCRIRRLDGKKGRLSTSRVRSKRTSDMPSHALVLCFILAEQLKRIVLRWVVRIGRGEKILNAEKDLWTGKVGQTGPESDRGTTG